MINNGESAVTNVSALINRIKDAQLVEGRPTVTVHVRDGGFPMSMMGAPNAVRRLEVGWDGLMFSVCEGSHQAYLDERELTAALPLGTGISVM